MYVMMLLTKRHVLFLVVNAALIFLNFNLWSYEPSGKTIYTLTPVASDASASGRPRDEPLSHDDLEELAPERIDSIGPNGERTVRKLPNSVIVDQWRKLHGNSSLSKPPVDIYVGDKDPKQVSVSTSFGAVREGYRVPAIETNHLVNCAKIIANDPAEHALAQQLMLTRPKVPIYEETYLTHLQDCAKFRSMRGYVEVPLTQVEEEWPLAFSVAMYNDFEGTERLIRSIYRPQNYYCIHVDIKSPLLLHRTVQAYASCFDNVWIASHLDKIKWGDVSVLLPEINCMKDMLKYHRSGKWKYFINLTGQEFPLRTNYEMARIASIFNGSNDIGGSTTRMEMDRIKFHWTHRWSKTYQQTIFYNTFSPKEPPPYNLTFFKGELHGLFSRKMVEFIIESPIAQKYLEWCWDSGHPSEHYWNVLNYNTHVTAPGGYIGPLDVADEYSDHIITRAKNWLGLYGNRTCHGKAVRGICVYGTQDSPWLATRPELFANKFHLTFQYIGYDCLEELHRNRTKLKDKIPFDEAFYKNLPTVKFSRKNGL